MNKTLELADDRLQMTLEAKAFGCECDLIERSSGRRWTAPLLGLHVHHRGLRRSEIVREFRIDAFEKEADGVHVVVADAFRRISFGLWLRLRDGELSVSCQPMELYEQENGLHRLFSVDLLPGLMRAEAGDALYLPLTTGALCDPAGKPAVSDRFLIYGEQERWELLPLLPFCAAWNAHGGIMGLAVRGAPDTICSVATDGAGSGSTGLGFSFRKRWHDPVDFRDREIRIVPLAPGDSPECSLAGRIRRHAMEDLGMRPLAERATESPEIRYALSAAIMKLFHGIQNDTGMLRLKYFPGKLASNTSFDTMMTFAEAGDNLRRLKRAGIERVLTFGVGWNPRGHDGMFPTRLPPDPRLGGEGGFRRLLSETAALGYCPSLHDNYTDAYRVSPDWDEDTIIRDEYGDPLAAGLWGGGIQHRVWPPALSDVRLSCQMRLLKEFGVRGMYYIDAIGCPLEVNYHPRHGGPRGDHARGIVRVLDAARDVFGAAAIEAGFLYAAQAADFVVGRGNLKRITEDVCGPIARLFDRQVPIWDIALHGLVMLGGSRDNQWPELLRDVLFGTHPLCEWTARPGMFPVLDETLILKLKSVNDLLVARFGHLQERMIVDYRRIGADAWRTTFDDGTEVAADFAGGELAVNGKTVLCPEPLRAKDAMPNN